MTALQWGHEHKNMNTKTFYCFTAWKPNTKPALPLPGFEPRTPTLKHAALKMYFDCIVLLYAAAVLLTVTSLSVCSLKQNILFRSCSPFILPRFSHFWPCRTVSASLDKPAKSVSRDALLPLQYASWSSEGAVLDGHRTGPLSHSSARFLCRMF